MRNVRIDRTWARRLARPVFETLPTIKRPVIAVLNKIDLVARPELLHLAGDLGDATPSTRTFMISALNGDGVPDLKTYLAEAVPPGPWLYPEDQLTDAPLRQAAAEITREKLFLRLHDELPYSLTVETDDWKELKDGSVRIEQTIYVDARQPEEDRARRQGRDHQGDLHGRAQGDRRDGRRAGASLSVREGARALGRGPERYREMGLGLPQGVIVLSLLAWT